MAMRLCLATTVTRQQSHSPSHGGFAQAFEPCSSPSPRRWLCLSLTSLRCLLSLADSGTTWFHATLILILGSLRSPPIHSPSSLAVAYFDHSPQVGFILPPLFLTLLKHKQGWWADNGVGPVLKWAEITCNALIVCGGFYLFYASIKQFSLSL